MSGSLTVTTAPAALPASRPPLRVPWVGLLAGVGWLALAGVTLALPEEGDFPRTDLFGQGAAGLGVAVLALSPLAPRLGAFGAWLRRVGPWLVVLALALLAWELVTAKFGWAPMPFFPPPQAILEVFVDDWPKLGGSILASLILLSGGYAFGAAVGFTLGVAIGTSRAVGYWAHPVLRFVGPLPATAWLPLAFFVFPSSWSASTFLVALATGFPSPC